MEQEYQKGYRWLYLAMGTVAMVFCGVSYAWAILKAPLAAEFDWSPAQLALNQTLSMLFIAFGNLLAGRLARVVPSRILLLCSGGFLFAGFLISSHMTGNILTLYFSNAGLCGIGIGCFVVTIITVMGKWFKDHKGLSTSFLQMGLGTGGLVISLLVTELTQNAGMAWRAVYALLGILTGGVLTIAAMIIREPAAEAKVSNNKEATLSIDKELNIHQMIRQREFQQYYLMNILVGTAGTVMLIFTNDFFLSLGCDTSMAVMMVGLLSIGNGLGRLVIGMIYDNKGRSFTLVVITGAALFSSVSLLLSVLAEGVFFGIIGTILAGISFGFIPAAAGPMIQEQYGSRHFASNYSITLTSSVPASFVAAIAGWILTVGGNFGLVYGLLCLLSFGSCVLCYRLNNPKCAM